jgi:asparagine synthase (glutamine-hydrolysing)
MVRQLRHRGPDGFGFFEDGDVGLAHARLSVIDFATGGQPQTNEDGSVRTIFNGEIFNYVELRVELEAAGHRFATQSDTETIVHAYEEYGDAFVEHLNGQFAIALWDARRRRLVLARDRLGIRPLFYTWHEGALLFASEVKALRAGIGRGLPLDVEGIAQVFTCWATVGERTAFRDVSMLPAGHMLVVEDGRPRVTRYWDWNFDPAPVPSFDEAAEQLRGLLVDAVRLQLRADVPVGAYLSGGLDSSGIVSIIRRHTGNPLRTFSIAFEDAEFDESPYQQQMARFLGTEHETLRCTRREIGEGFPDFVWHAEAPVLRTAPVPLMLLAERVRAAGIKVVLTGEGADEVFGGYDLFKEGKVRRFWAQQPDSAWRPSLLRRLYPYLRHSPVGNQAFAATYFGRSLADTHDPGYAHRARWTTTRRLWNLFTPEARGMLDAGAGELTGLELPAAFNEWEALSRDQYIEAKTLLEGYLLAAQGDRVAMAHSVEGRVPFLDHRVVEFAGRLPARYKLRGLREKAVLKAALAGLLPDEIRARTKQPYRAPDSPCFFEHGEPLPWVAQLLGERSLRDAGWFDAAAVARLVAKCRAGRAIGFGDNMALVGVLSTMLLHEQFAHGASTYFESTRGKDHEGAGRDQGFHRAELPLHQRRTLAG